MINGGASEFGVPLKSLLGILGNKVPLNAVFPAKKLRGILPAGSSSLFLPYNREFAANTGFLFPCSKIEGFSVPGHSKACPTFEIQY